MRVRASRGRFPLLGALAAGLLVPAARADADPCASTGMPSLRELIACMTVGAVREHQAQLQAIADANGGTRSSGTPGYEASVAYAVSVLAAAGYEVTVASFDFPFFQELGMPVLERFAPDTRVYVSGVDFATIEYSAASAIAAAVVPVDLVLPPGAAPDASTSGCETTDFATFPPGAIALLQRGTCPLAVKAVNAEAAGALGAIIFNEGQVGRTELLRGTLAAPVGAIPVVGTTFAVGGELAALAATGEVVVSLVVDAISELRTSENVFAETVGGDDTAVVMAGAHLDSVLAGPGIQDNGSGVAVLLELAQQLGPVAPANTIRFAFWGAGEWASAGAAAYVAALTDAERAAVAAYLNFDMVGSPNFVRFIYDGDGSVYGEAGPRGSDKLETLFEKIFRRLELPTDAVSLALASDHRPFLDAAIPVGGLFTGAAALKTAAQAATYGGTAGAPYDPCFHQPCDTYANVSEQVLGEMAQAIAATVFHLARNIDEIDDARTAQHTGAGERGSVRSEPTADPVAA